MDEHEISQMAKRCKHLKYKFNGVFAADNFPPIPRNSFQVVNTSPSSDFGTHWVLFCNNSDVVVFADPLGLSILNYKHLYKKILTQYTKVFEILLNNPLQPENSNDCALYCLYVAHCIFSKLYPKVPHISNIQLHRFVKHMQ